MEGLRNKRVLVTGAAGFIGANLVRQLLRQGACLHAIARSETRLWRIADVVHQVSLHVVDLADRKRLQATVRQVNPEVIFHLAAQGIVHSERNLWDTVRANVLGTVNLLEACATLDYERFVQVGGSTEYGARCSPMKESDRVEPTTLYGASKAAATLLCQTVARAERRPVVVLRPFSVFGYWEPATRLVPMTILATMRSQPIDLTVPGFRRDFVFVEDVVEACILAAQATKAVGKTINVGTGQESSNEEVVSLVQQVIGKATEVRIGQFPPRVSDVAHWVCDPRKAGRLLHWEARHCLRDGIEKSVSWFQRHIDSYPLTW